MRFPASRPGLALLIALLTFVLTASALASPPTKLSVHKARAVTARKAKSFKHELEGDGATGSRVSTCTRRSRRRVNCIAVVTGYDAELDFDWTCVTEIKVRKSAKRNARGSRIRVGYGLSACG
jgi:hypothetical protein